jgi:dTDP-D-glucose 4,6-dehydratase
MKQTVAWYVKNEAWWKRRKSEEFWRFYQENYKGLPQGAVPSSG